MANGVQLISAEPELPYQRPPLSKGFLKNPEEVAQLIRSQSWFAQAGVHCHLNAQVVRINRAQRQLILGQGEAISYGSLVLATGTRARQWPMLPQGVSNACSLRTVLDANHIRSQLANAMNIVVIGGGFIGLEVAATARSLGKNVVLLEMAPRLMGRSVSAALAQHVTSVHVAHGIDVRTNARVDSIHTVQGKITALTVNTETLPCDFLLVAIGAEPEVGLACEAGLTCDNGIVVDEGMGTSDPEVFAIGDCTSFPLASQKRVRLESVQNANDQARVLAARIAGEHVAYQPVPWFWSEQGNMRLQMVGFLPTQAQSWRRPGSNANSFSLFHYDANQLVCVESVNAPIDHMAARKLLEGGLSPTPEQVINPDVPLKSWLSY
jgi:3-phenylpropionate/trans-cinnamate dioxygenase ferredoxin reductase subunit